jgi:hypothetical protein
MRELLHMVVSGLAGRLLGVTGSRRVVEPVEPIRMVFGSIGSGCHHSGHSFNAYLTDFYPATNSRSTADQDSCPVQGVDSTCNPSHEPMMSQAFEQLSNSS